MKLCDSCQNYRKKYCWVKFIAIGDSQIIEYCNMYKKRGGRRADKR